MEDEYATKGTALDPSVELPQAFRFHGACAGYASRTVTLTCNL